MDWLKKAMLLGLLCAGLVVSGSAVFQNVQLTAGPDDIIDDSIEK